MQNKRKFWMQYSAVRNVTVKQSLSHSLTICEAAARYWKYRKRIVIIKFLIIKNYQI